jgi:carbonic anhydrase
MTSMMTPLLEHNEQFARTFTPVPLGLPAAQVIVITCLDHRVDPAITLGLRLGDAPVLRNAGGRVTQPVIDEIAYLAFLGRRLGAGQRAGNGRVEVAVIHHTQCGTAMLANPAFRREAAEATGIDEATLEVSAVDDPYVTVATDVERLLASPMFPAGLGVSGHVYDVDTGRITTVVETRYPEPVTSH